MFKIQLILIFSLFILKHQVVDAIYCYECNANWEPCGTPADISKIQQNLVPCSGSCVTYYNSKDGYVLYRACSNTVLEIEHMGGESGIFEGIDGNFYDLCTEERCNGVDTALPIPPDEIIQPTLSSYSIVTSSLRPSTFTTTVRTTTTDQTTTTEETTTSEETTTQETTTTTIATTTLTTPLNCVDSDACASFNLTEADCASKYTSNMCPGSCSKDCKCYDNPTCLSYNLTPTDCASKFTLASCPKTCACINAPTTTPPPTTTTTTPTTTTTLNCYDNPTCSSYNLNPTDCASTFTRNMCPNTCTCVNVATSPGPTTSPAVTTTSIDMTTKSPVVTTTSTNVVTTEEETTTTPAPEKNCTAIKCVSGTVQIDKTGSCVCVCNENYYGTECDKINITAIASTNDPAECNELKCADSDIATLCPITCKICGGAIYCKNGGNVDPDTCQCACLDGFVGATCESTS